MNHFRNSSNSTFYEYNGNLFQNQFLQAKFSFENRKLTNASIYLDEEFSAFLDEKLKTNVLRTYIEYLLKKYKPILPKIIPRNQNIKKLIQPRVENRTRYCFRPFGECFWELKLIALAADISIGYLIACMLWVEMNGVEKDISIPEKVVISSNFKKFTPKFALSYNPFTGKIQRKFRYLIQYEKF